MNMLNVQSHQYKMRLEFYGSNSDIGGILVAVQLDFQDNKQQKHDMSS